MIRSRILPAVLLRGFVPTLVVTLGLWLAGALMLRVTVASPEVCTPITADEAVQSGLAAADWIVRVQEPDGSYLYEYDIDEVRAVDGYNTVRHAGVTMSLYQAAAEGFPEYIEPADLGLSWLDGRMFRHDGWAASVEDDGSIKLGTNALLVAGLAERRVATGDPAYDDLLRDAGRFLIAMQLPDGAFLERWRPELGGPDPSLRSLYATGEAFWALTLLHRHFPTEGWDEPARAVARYLALERDSYEDIEFPPWADQWAAYGFAEMASWPIDEELLPYVRSIAERFGFLIRAESRRNESWLSGMLHGPESRAAGMGTWVEALGSLWRLASADPRLADIRDDLGERLACGAAMLRDRQVPASEAATTAAPEIAEGAWFDEGITRMDDQQHALSGLIRARAMLADRDGRPR